MPLLFCECGAEGGAGCTPDSGTAFMCVSVRACWLRGQSAGCGPSAEAAGCRHAPRLWFGKSCGVAAWLGVRLLAMSQLWGNASPVTSSCFKASFNLFATGVSLTPPRGNLSSLGSVPLLLPFHMSFLAEFSHLFFLLRTDGAHVLFLCLDTKSAYRVLVRSLK